MMLSWPKSLFNFVIWLEILIIFTGANGNMLQTVLGLPSECIHRNKIRPCKLSFSCWLQGGKHVHGCGGNKWLFSCCVSERDYILAAATAAAAAAAAAAAVSVNSVDVDSIAAAASGTSSIYLGTAFSGSENGIPLISNNGGVGPGGGGGGGVGPGPGGPAVIIKRKPTYLIALKESKRHRQPPKLSLKFSKKNSLRRRTDVNNNHQTECGISKNSHNTIQKRIIGGRMASFAEYPWQAHIRIAEFQCGGVLVSRNFIATAAHCIQQARLKDIFVYLGELDTQNSGIAKEPFPAEKYHVIKKVIHPRFQFRITQPDRYDLALLQLGSPVVYKNHILPICLPTSTLELVGSKGVIAGWGKTQANMGHTGTNLLQKAAVPIIDTDDCIKWHESKDINVELFEEMFCAGHSDGHQDACLGDSGGPLIVKDNKGRFTLVGITSAGFGCGIDHQPGIYHNVQLTYKWIQNIIYKIH